MAPDSLLVGSLPNPVCRKGRSARLWRRTVLPPLVLVTFACVIGLLTYRTTTKLDTAAVLAGEPIAAQWGLADFRDNLYYPVVSFLEGQNPYDRAAYMRRYPVVNGFPLYLPLTLLIYLPFGLLSLGIAQWLHFGATIVLTVVLATLTLRFCRCEATWTRVLALSALVLVSRPGHWNLALGNCAVPAVLGIYVALLYARRNPWVATFGLALSTFKPTFGIPAAILMFAAGCTWVALAGLTISTVLCVGVLSVLTTQAGGFESFFGSIHANYIDWQTVPVVNPAVAPFRVDIVAMVGRLVDQPPALQEAILLSAAVLLVGGIGVRRAVRVTADGVGGMLPASIVCTAVLASTYHQAYDLLLLLLPLTALLAGPLPEPLGEQRWCRGLLIALLSLPAANYLASGTAIDALGISGVLWLIVTSMNGVALIVALLIYTSLALRQPVPSSLAKRVVLGGS